MRLYFAAIATLLFANFLSADLKAQQPIGPGPNGVPWCNGPLGPGPCADIQRWFQLQGQASQSTLPGAGMLPRDGYIVMTIAENCRGEPRCMAMSWGAVEVQRCRGGFGQPGGCFGPNGEILRAMNRILPQHLRTDVLVRNVQNDIQNGPGSTNDVVGCEGWLASRLGVGC